MGTIDFIKTSNTSAIAYQNGKAIAFVDGLKPDHECNDDGPTMLFDNHGNYYIEPEYIKGSEESHNAYAKFYEEKNITGSCVSCNICGQPFTPNFLDMP